MVVTSMTMRERETRGRTSTEEQEREEDKAGGRWKYGSYNLSESEVAGGDKPRKMGDTNSLSDETKPYSLVTKCLAEFVGDLIFVFIGTIQAASAGDGVTHAAFAHGLTIFLLVAAFGHISGGHFNPAVTLSIALTGKINYLHVPAYIISQLAGGFFGALCTRVILGSDEFSAINAGATLLDPNRKWYQGFVAEILVTFILCNSVLLTAVDTSSNLLAPLAIGFSLTVDIFAVGSLTGASMNPARSLGPNLAGAIFHNGSLPSGFWSNHYIYWVGPAIGAVIAAALYRTFYARRSRLLR